MKSQILLADELSFSDHFQSHRDRYLRFANSLLRDAMSAEDVIQSVQWRILLRIRAGQTITDAYIFTSIKNACIDKAKERRRHSQIIHRAAQILPIDNFEDPVLNDPWHMTESESASLVSQLPPLQQQDFLAKVLRDGRYVDIASRNERSVEAVRKSIQKATNNYRAHFIHYLIQIGDFRRLNGPRISERTAYRVASIFCAKKTDVGLITEVFRHKELNRAIQNMTWVLMAMQEMNGVKGFVPGDFLITQLLKGDLYRGNKSYIAEALLELGFKKHINQVCNNFIRCINDFGDRITSDNRVEEEQREVNSLCIYDVKQVRHIGRKLSRQNSLELQREYLSGQGTVDARRCMAFQLLRVHQDDEQFVRNVLLHLNDEQDQTNAYYVIKYLHNWGLIEHPSLLNSEILRAVEAARNRFSRNTFISKTYEVLRHKIL